MSHENIDEDVIGYKNVPKDSLFYTKAKDYWSKTPATIDGVLGGFGHISSRDVKSSRKFLDSLFQLEFPPAKDRVLDCGAGIGRISVKLFSHIFSKVDLVELNQQFLVEAKQKLVPTGKLGEIYCCGLQEFEPTNNYDIIWCQWVMGHLTDQHLIEFFQKCQASLNQCGLIVVKENCTTSDEVELDSQDSSVTRPVKHWLELFQKSSLEIVKQEKQTNFPQRLYPVWMFALKPAKR